MPHSVRQSDSEREKGDLVRGEKSNQCAYTPDLKSFPLLHPVGALHGWRKEDGGPQSSFFLSFMRNF